MSCISKHKIKNKEGFAVKSRDTTIKTTTEVRYLGVNLDDTLSGEGILNTIVKKCSVRIKFLSTGRPDVSQRLYKRPCANHRSRAT